MRPGLRSTGTTLGAHICQTPNGPRAGRICPWPSRSLNCACVWLLVSSTRTYSASGPVPQVRPSPWAIGTGLVRPGLCGFGLGTRAPTCLRSRPTHRRCSRSARHSRIANTSESMCAAHSPDRHEGLAFAKAQGNPTLQPLPECAQPIYIRPRRARWATAASDGPRLVCVSG